MTKPTPSQIEDFLRESNAIESVYDEDSLQQALYAWEYLMTQKKLDHTAIKKTHKILMLHQPLQPHERGYYRERPVYIGGKEATSWKFIEHFLDDWIKKMNTKTFITDMQGQNNCRLLHVEYEKIHPFIDGNGRTGRMFMNWWRLRNGLPLSIIHEGKEQMEYYKWFQ